MSEETMKVALAALDAWNRGDREAFMSAWDEQAEFVPLRAQLESEVYRGIEAVDRFLTELTNEWEAVRFEINETRGAEDQVVGIGRFRARGNASGVEINVPLGVLMRVRRGKIVYTRFFSDPSEAVAAAGLSN
jgi:ketosteroid isomerase-like protein